MAQAPLQILGIIAGNGVYPKILATAARKGGVAKIVAAAFTDETDPAISQHVDAVEWLRVGQLGRLLKFFREHDVHRVYRRRQSSAVEPREDWSGCRRAA